MKEVLPDGAHSSSNVISAPGPVKIAMDETTLGKLSRTQLQKVAKDHGVRANMRSVVIIKELVKLNKVVPILQDEESEEPPRKKSKMMEEGHPAAGPSTRTIDQPLDTSLDLPVIQKDTPTPILIPAAENKTPRKAAGHVGGIASDNLGGKFPSLSPLLGSPNGHPAAEGGSSDSGDSYLSYGSPRQQQYYNSPVSSRAGTPPPEEPHLLNRAVNIMKQIMAEDQLILVQAAALRQRAAGLKEQARNVHDVGRAERGRRERLQAFFTHWREIAPNWPKDWIYKAGEEDRLRTERVLRTMTPPLPSTGPTGPPTLSLDINDAPGLRQCQLQPRHEARMQKNGTAAPAAEVEQLDQGANRLPSPKLATKGRVAKRQHCT